MNISLSPNTQTKVIDFESPEDNDWLAVNQFTMVEDQHTRRPDVVLTCGGSHG